MQSADDDPIIVYASKVLLIASQNDENIKVLLIASQNDENIQLIMDDVRWLCVQLPLKLHTS